MKIPVPIVHPTPRQVSPTSPIDLESSLSPVSLPDSASICVAGLRRNMSLTSDDDIGPLLFGSDFQQIWMSLDLFRVGVRSVRRPGTANPSPGGDPVSMWVSSH
jgi:hypothetical protein